MIDVPFSGNDLLHLNADCGWRVNSLLGRAPSGTVFLGAGRKVQIAIASQGGTRQIGVIILFETLPVARYLSQLGLTTSQPADFRQPSNTRFGRMPAWLRRSSFLIQARQQGLR